MKRIEKVISLLQLVSSLVSSLTVVLVTTLIFSNTAAVKDVLYHSFKAKWSFISFIILFILTLYILSIKISEIKESGGIVQDPKVEKAVKWNKTLRIRIRLLKIGVCLLLLVNFSIMLCYQFTNFNFGILQGDMDDKKFGQGVYGIISMEKGSDFEITNDSEVNYGSIGDTNFTNEKFTDVYNNGAVYATQYDAAWKVLNIKIRWVGRSRCFSDSIFNNKEFSDCTLKLNDDKEMVADYILGFICMHMCDTGNARKYFTKVSTAVNAVKDSVKKEILKPLLKWIDTFMKVTANLSEPEQIKKIFPEIYSDLPDTLVTDYISGIWTADSSISFRNMIGAFKKYPIYVFKSHDTMVIMEELTDKYLTYNSEKTIKRPSEGTTEGQDISSGKKAVIKPEEYVNIVDTIDKSQLKSYIEEKLSRYSRYKISRFPRIKWRD